MRVRQCFSLLGEEGGASLGAREESDHSAIEGFDDERLQPPMTNTCTLYIQSVLKRSVNF